MTVVASISKLLEEVNALRNVDLESLCKYFVNFNFDGKTIKFYPKYFSFELLTSNFWFATSKIYKVSLHRHVNVYKFLWVSPVSILQAAYHYQNRYELNRDPQVVVLVRKLPPVHCDSVCIELDNDSFAVAHCKKFVNIQVFVIKLVLKCPVTLENTY